MKYFLAVGVTIVLAYVAGLFLPWWSVAIAAFIASFFIKQSPGESFRAGFTGSFILWAVLCLYINMQNDSMLAGRVAKLFGTSSAPLILITALVGGLTSGLAALSASYLRKA